MKRCLAWPLLGLLLILLPTSLLLSGQEREGRSGGNTAQKDKEPTQGGDKAAPEKEEFILRVDGKLTAADPKDKKGKGSHYKIHTVKLEEGTTYVIDMVSDDFDAFLRLEDRDGKQVAEDDDGGGGTNSRIVYDVTKANAYSIIVTSFESGATGKFTLVVKELDRIASERFKLEAKASELDAIGVKYHKGGEFDKALESHRKALLIREKLYPKEQFPQGHTRLAESFNQVGFLLKAQGEYTSAESYYEKALKIDEWHYRSTKSAQALRDLAGSHNNLGSLLQAQGNYAQAMPHLRQAVAMFEKLYPKGHPDLALGLSNLGFLLHAQGAHAAAEATYQKALEVHKALPALIAATPEGKQRLSQTLNYLGLLFEDQDQYVKAESYFRKALALKEECYPKQGFPGGHPDLALGLSNMGFVIHAKADYAQAEVYYRKALAMNQALFPETSFPQGHPQLAVSFSNLGSLLQAKGDFAEAERHITAAVRMVQQQVLLYADLASEAEALDFSGRQGWSALPRFLSFARQRAHRIDDYGFVWSGRSVVTRIAERRHQDVLAAVDERPRNISAETRKVRRRLADLLLRAEIKGVDAHRREVEELTRKKEALEKELALALRLPLPSGKTYEITPARLQSALSDGTAFIDVIHYLNFDQDPKVPGRKGVKHTARYLAYIVMPKRILRADLKEAAPIEKAWAAWRKAIVNNARDERETASKFAELVWAPIAKQLPAGVKIIYLAPDGLLTQVPWAALPGSKPGSVLLEDFTITTVPHGPYLLQRLTAPARKEERGGILVVGGVDYDEPPIKVATLEEGQRGPLVGKFVWPALPGTKKELRQVAELATKVKLKPVERSAIDASTEQVLADLGNVRYAHLATHGFFADAKFRSALEVDPKLFEMLSPGSKAAGARSPLVLSGLVFAGANRQGEMAAPDRGILTAEAIVGQRLEGMDLAVLSACETGLGEVGGGEGVYGLARAFHVAGCKNVIASLWKVDDEPTAALMGLFYRNLWIEKKSPLESLRLAQLHLYRHPEQIPALAKLRGIDFAERDLPKVTLPPPTGRTAPTSQWAAFVLSGLGAR